MPVMIEHAEGDKFWFGFFPGDAMGVYKGGKRYNEIKKNSILRSVHDLGPTLKKVMLLAMVKGVGDEDEWDGDLDWSMKEGYNGEKGWMFIGKASGQSIMRAYCKGATTDKNPEENWNWISARDGVEPDWE